MTSFADIERMMAEDILSDISGNEPETAELIGAANWIFSTLADRVRCGDLLPNELGALLEFTWSTKQFADVVLCFAHDEATAGRAPAGYKLVQAHRYRRWSDPSAVMDALVDMPGVRLRDVTTPVSPLHMEQRLGANLCAELDQYVALTDAGTRLAPESSRKPAIVVSVEAPATERLKQVTSSPVPELRSRRVAGTREADNAPKKAARRPTRPRRRFGKQSRGRWSRY
jgi:hypothetical protein